MKVFWLVFALLLAGSLDAQDVFKTPSGAKYHLESCRMVNNVSARITVGKAAYLGLEPCKICKPSSQLPQNLVAGKAQGERGTSQCVGMTKAGARCRHMTRIGNGYCYQHQPK